jgi:two-component system sensor histidine kinase and response regulator WspE
VKSLALGIPDTGVSLLPTATGGGAARSVPPPRPDAVEPELAALFVAEVEGAAPRLQELVLALEHDDRTTSDAEEAMRLAHSLKGAARIVGLNGVVALLHAAEDTLSSAARGRVLVPTEIQALLRLIDLLEELTATPVAGVARWIADRQMVLADIESMLRRPILIPEPQRAAPALPPVPVPITPTSETVSPEAVAVAAAAASSDGRALRVSADSLSRLLGLAGETVVEARRLSSWSRSSFAVERVQARMVSRAQEVRRRAAASGDTGLAALVDGLVADVAQSTRMLAETREATVPGLQRLLDVGERLYVESLRARQRPFAQLVPGMRRLVRDLAKSLGKNAKLEVAGSATLVDGDVLSAVEPMLQHLLTNAIDHGIEAPAIREQRRKPATGTVRVELRHARGQLSLSVSDDGGGVDVEQVRSAVIARALTDEMTARALGKAELLEFLFLPAFSTARTLSVHSGRGVGLDAVRTEIVRLGGRIVLESEVGAFTRFDLSLPVTRVVVRALLFRVAGDAYALPLARAGRVVRVPSSALQSAEGRDYVELDGENVGVIRADDVLELVGAPEPGDDLTLVLLGDQDARYGLAVDSALGEDDLVVRPLDPRLGRVPDVAATALLADGSPTLVLDADDLMASIIKLSRRRRPQRARGVATPAAAPTRRQRILVVDDSVTVREVERQVLAARGYEVDVAVDGVDAWTALRSSDYDLLVVDVDMPRMDGIELTRAVRADERLSKLPVIIVSYRERDEDRLRGLEVGADLYLAKSTFHDDQLVHAVRDLIGEPPS